MRDAQPEIARVAELVRRGRGTGLRAIGCWVALLAVLVGMLLSGCSGSGGDEQAEEQAATTAPAETSSPPRRAPATTSSAPSAPPAPADVPGYSTEPVGPDSFRLSQVFRLRNTLLNGLSGGASQYSLTTTEAERDGEVSLLVWITALPGESVPDVSNEVRSLLDLPLVATDEVCGRTITTYRASDEALAALALGPRESGVVLSASPGEARDLAAAAARASMEDCPSS